MQKSFPDISDTSYDSTVYHCAYNIPNLAEMTEEERGDCSKQFTNKISNDIGSSHSTPLISNTESNLDMLSNFSRDNFNPKNEISSLAEQKSLDMYRVFLNRRESNINLLMSEAITMKEKLTFLESCHHDDPLRGIYINDVDDVIEVNINEKCEDILCDNDNLVNTVEYISYLESKIDNLEKNHAEINVQSQLLAAQWEDACLDDKEANMSKGSNLSTQKNSCIIKRAPSMVTDSLSARLMDNEEHKKENKKKKTKIIYVRSTSTLEEGHVFSIDIDSKLIIVPAPKGGIKRGEIVKVCLQTLRVIK